jgi:TldD protein
VLPIPPILDYIGLTMPDSYQAPFLPGGSSPVDADSCNRLLSIALEQGGHEFGASASFGFEEGILKSASRSVVIGLGVRVQHGECTGYAFTEDLGWEKMVRAAKTAAQIARSGSPTLPVAVSSKLTPSRYALPAWSIDTPGQAKRDLLQRASDAAHRADSRVTKVETSLVESLRQLLIATSDGVFASDAQPMLRFGVRAIAERDGQRRSGFSGGGGRTDMSYFASHSVEEHAQAAVRQAITMLDAREAPAGQFEVVLAPGDSGILLHEAVGHGLEADFNRKGTSNYAGRLGSQVASRLCTVVDDATPSAPGAPSTSTMRATCRTPPRSSSAARSPPTCRTGSAPDTSRPRPPATAGAKASRSARCPG